MGRCKRCGKEGWGVRTTREGLCKPCRVSVGAEVAKGLQRIKDILIYLRCANDPSSLLPLCDEALREARELLHLERRGLAEIHPLPSSLVAMLEAKRNEVVAELRMGEDARVSRGATAASSAGSAEVGAFPPTPGEPSPQGENRAEEAESSASAAWWAWDVSEGGGSGVWAEEGGSEPGQIRRPVREKLHCLVLLDPGGVRATLENISQSGLFLSTPRLREPGSRVRLILNTLQGPLQAEGVVRWTRGGSEAALAPGPPGMGVEFTNSSPELRAYLAARFPSLHAAGAGPA